MYTIKQASRLTGVSETLLRAWERRYEVVVPHRSDSGYRLYDDDAVAALSTMRRLIDDGWSPAQAAHAVRTGIAPPEVVAAPGGDQVDAASGPNGYRDLLLSSAARMDTVGIEASLDGGFALGSFEHVVDTWLFPALEELGEAWARGDVDVAGEHAASHAVQRRLSAAYDAAGSRHRGPTVVVGLPPGSQHDLGALAFATALRRRGIDVLYLGADVPADSWEAAVGNRSARAAVLSVVTPEDRAAAAEVAGRLLAHERSPIVCAGGTSGADLAPGVRSLPHSIAAAAADVDDLLHDSPPAASTPAVS